MKKALAISIFFLAGLMSACKEANNEPQHPLAGERRIKNIESGANLVYRSSTSQDGFDVVNGNNEMKIIAGPGAGQYYISPKIDADKYLDIAGAIYTYIVGKTFSNTNTQLFSFIPIMKGSDRYYIRSVADTSKYLVSSYASYGSATTLTIGQRSRYWDQIWILEEL